MWCTCCLYLITQFIVCDGFLDNEETLLGPNVEGAQIASIITNEQNASISEILRVVTPSSVVVEGTGNLHQPGNAHEGVLSNGNSVQNTQNSQSMDHLLPTTINPDYSGVTRPSESSTNIVPMIPVLLQPDSTRSDVIISSLITNPPSRTITPRPQVNTVPVLLSSVPATIPVSTSAPSLPTVTINNQREITTFSRLASVTSPYRPKNRTERIIPTSDYQEINHTFSSNDTHDSQSILSNRSTSDHGLSEEFFPEAQENSTFDFTNGNTTEVSNVTLVDIDGNYSNETTIFQDLNFTSTEVGAAENQRSHHGLVTFLPNPSGDVNETVDGTETDKQYNKLGNKTMIKPSTTAPLTVLTSAEIPTVTAPITVLTSAEIPTVTAPLTVLTSAEIPTVPFNNSSSVIVSTTLSSSPVPTVPLTTAPRPPHGSMTTSSTRTSHGLVTTAPTRASHGPVTTALTRASHGPVTTASTRTSHGPVTTASTRTSHGPVTTAPTRASHGPVTTASTKTSHGPVTTASTRTSHRPVTTASARTSPGPVTTASTRTSHRPVTTTSTRTSPRPVTTASTRTSPGPVTTASTRTSQRPITTAATRTSPGLVTTASTRTSPGPVTTASTRTSPGPVTTASTRTSQGPVTTSSTRTSQRTTVTTVPRTTVTTVPRTTVTTVPRTTVTTAPRTTVTTAPRTTVTTAPRTTVTTVPRTTVTTAPRTTVTTAPRTTETTVRRTTVTTTSRTTETTAPRTTVATAPMTTVTTAPRTTVTTAPRTTVTTAPRTTVTTAPRTTETTAPRRTSHGPVTIDTRSTHHRETITTQRLSLTSVIKTERSSVTPSLTEANYNMSTASKSTLLKILLSSTISTEPALLTSLSSSTPSTTIPSTTYGSFAPDSTNSTNNSSRTTTAVLDIDPPVYIRLSLEMNWREFCHSQHHFVRELLEIVEVRAGHLIRKEQLIFLNGAMFNCKGDPEAVDEDILIRLYVSDLNGHYSSDLTAEVAEVIRAGFTSSSSFKNKVKEVCLVGKGHEDPSGAPGDEEEPGTIIAIVIACVGGVCCVVLVMLQLVLRHRHTHKSSVITGKQRSSLRSVDSIALNMVKPRPHSGLYNPALDTEDLTCHSHPVDALSLSILSVDVQPLYQQFQLLPNECPSISDVPIGCEEKNRYSNVLPFSETRVRLTRLPKDDTSDYINANYVTGYKERSKAYIATQAPLKSTIVDFWRMVWEQQSRVIVMLTPMQEHGLSRCAEYWPDTEGVDTKRLYGDYQLELKKKEILPECIISSLVIKNMDLNLTRRLTHFWFTNWQQNKTPEPITLVKFLSHVRPYTEETTAPTIVHCSPGTGRTGCLIAIDICMRMIDDVRTADVLQSVSQMRRERSGAVQTREQYALIYKTLNEYVSQLESPSSSPSTSHHSLDIV